MLKGKAQLSVFFMLTQYDKTARQRISSMKRGILKTMACVCILKQYQNTNPRMIFLQYFKVCLIPEPAN